jgi:hypothetical protein
VLGGQVVAQIAEINGNGTWQRGYVYLGGQLVQNAVYWVHQDPLAKSKRVTNGSGNVVINPTGFYAFSSVQWMIRLITENPGDISVPLFSG